MNVELRGWPQYANAGEALSQETASWGARLETAKRRYDELDGEIGAAVTHLAIGIVDGNESPDQFSMLKAYEGRFDETSAALLQINYDSETPQSRVGELLEAIRGQREETGVQAAISVCHYDKREFGVLRTDAWDIATVHGLRSAAEVPIIGNSNDADMSGTSSLYWSRMISNQYVGQPAKLWSSNVLPQTFGDPDCIANRMIRYLFEARALKTQITGGTLLYGASTATTLDSYVKSVKGWKGPIGNLSEPMHLARHIHERATGETLPEDEIWRAVAERTGVVSEDAYAMVSARRETVELATFLAGNEYPMTLINTSPDNAYRRLTPKQLAELAEGAPNNEARVRQELTRLEKNFRRKHLDPSVSSRLGEALNQARQKLDLPEPNIA
jgi:hypothetical protein